MHWWWERNHIICIENTPRQTDTHTHNKAKKAFGQNTFDEFAMLELARKNESQSVRVRVCVCGVCSVRKTTTCCFGACFAALGREAKKRSRRKKGCLSLSHNFVEEQRVLDGDLAECGVAGGAVCVCVCEENIAFPHRQNNLFCFGKHTHAQTQVKLTLQTKQQQRASRFNIVSERASRFFLSGLPVSFFFTPNRPFAQHAPRRCCTHERTPHTHTPADTVSQPRFAHMLRVCFFESQNALTVVVCGVSWRCFLALFAFFFAKSVCIFLSVTHIFLSALLCSFFLNQHRLQKLAFSSLLL